MNRKSRIFFIISVSAIVIPIIIGMSFIHEVGNRRLRVPSEVEQLSYEYLENMRDETLISEIYDNISELKLINYQYGEANTSKIHDLIYEIERPDHFLKYSVQVINNSGNFEISKIEIYHNEYSLDRNRKFTLRNKTNKHYLVLIISTVVLVFCIYSAALCFGETQENKWKRSLLILCGVGTMAFNWNTGQITYSLISVAIPAVSIAYGANYSVHSIVFHVPIGLIMYWLMRHKEKTNSELV